MVKTNAGQQNLQQSLKNKDKMAVCRKQGDQKIRKKNLPNFSKKSLKKLPSQKKAKISTTNLNLKGQNIYNK
jgi:hypothetical protein